MSGLFSFWNAEFGLDKYEVCHLFAAELDPAKQQFKAAQFPSLQRMVKDVEELKEHKVTNLLTRKCEFLPWPQVFGGCFSCKGNSKQNSNRKKQKGCIMNQEGCSGKTFEALRCWVVRCRPKIFFLENVPEVQQSVEMEDGTSSSDAQYAKSCFEKEISSSSCWTSAPVSLARQPSASVGGSSALTSPRSSGRAWRPGFSMSSTA